MGIPVHQLQQLVNTHIYLCMCVTWTECNENQKSNETCRLSKNPHSLRLCIFFQALKHWTHQCFLHHFISRTFRSCSPPSFFRPLENAETLEGFWCVLITFHISYCFPGKKKKAGKQENLTWNIGAKPQQCHNWIRKQKCFGLEKPKYINLSF